MLLEMKRACMHFVTIDVIFVKKITKLKSQKYVAKIYRAPK